MSAVSRATSVPLMPIAMPMSARFRAGASFTPSPVIPTTCPLARSASTIRTLCCGDTRAKTLAVSSAVESASSPRLRKAHSSGKREVNSRTV